MRHEVYDRLTEPEREAADSAFSAVSSVLAMRGMRAAMDDRAEDLVEAIAVFIEESKP